MGLTHRVERDGGPGVRHGRLLRRRDRAWCESRRSAGQDGTAVSPQTEVDGARSHDPTNHQDGATPMEEGGRLPSAGRRGECLLPVQVYARRRSTSPNGSWTGGRIGACVQRAESDERAWPAEVSGHRSVTKLRVAIVRTNFDLCNNAQVRHGFLRKWCDMPKRGPSTRQRPRN